MARYHLKIKLLTEAEVGKVEEEQVFVRECYMQVMNEAKTIDQTELPPPLEIIDRTKKT